MSAEAETIVWRHSPYKGMTLWVQREIASIVNDQHDNLFWGSVSRLAERMRVSRRTVQNAINQMVEDGWLVEIDQNSNDARGGTNTYRFRVPDQHLDVVYETDLDRNLRSDGRRAQSPRTSNETPARSPRTSDQEDVRNPRTDVRNPRTDVRNLRAQNKRTNKKQELLTTTSSDEATEPADELAEQSSTDTDLEPTTQPPPLTPLSLVPDFESGTPPKSACPYESDFADLWELYPRRVSRSKARAQYVARRRAGADPAVLREAAERYGKAMTVLGKAAEYVMHGATFFARDDGPWSEWADPDSETVAEARAELHRQRAQQPAPAYDPADPTLVTGVKYT